MDSPEATTKTSNIKDRIASQAKSFGHMLGQLIAPDPVAHKDINELVKLGNNPDVKFKQQKIIKVVLENLIRKNILASPKENNQFYEQRFGLNLYSAPEEFLKLPGGATAVDEKTGQMRIYLNPHLEMFETDYQLLSILEESIHWFQFKHTGESQGYKENELDSKARLLKMADFLGLSSERKAYLEQERSRWAKK